MGKGNLMMGLVILSVCLLGSVPLASTEGIQYNHSDHLGSTNIVTGNNGTTVEQTFYSPYGEILKVVKYQGIKTTNFKYTSQEFDSESDLHYYGARYYDPASSRFLSRDAAMGNYPYSYVDNRPVRFIDPDGNVPQNIDSLSFNERWLYDRFANELKQHGLTDNFPYNLKFGSQEEMGSEQRAARTIWPKKDPNGPSTPENTTGTPTIILLRPSIQIGPFYIGEARPHDLGHEWVHAKDPFGEEFPALALSYKLESGHSKEHEEVFQEHLIRIILVWKDAFYENRYFGSSTPYYYREAVSELEKDLKTSWGPEGQFNSYQALKEAPSSGSLGRTRERLFQLYEKYGELLIENNLSQPTTEQVRPILEELKLEN